MPIDFLGSNAEQIIFKVTSDKCTVRLANLDESIEDYCENLDPESKYMTNFTIKAFAADENGEEIIEAGFIEAIYFEAESIFSEEISFAMLCDMISSDADSMAAAITDRHGRIIPTICHHGHNLMYIEKLFVEEKCRGHGIGRYLLDNMLSLLWHALSLRPHAVILLPYPQEKTRGGSLLNAENAKDDLPRLVSFYENAGYTKLDGCDFMFKKNTDILEEIFAQMEE